MTRWALALLATLGCASTGANPPDASSICPDSHELSALQIDGWVTLSCQLPDGVPDGPAIIWDREAARLVGVLHFEDGQLHGPARTWQQNGRLGQESYYIHGSNEGELRLWHDNGRLEVLAHYDGDQLEGPWLQWREDGSLRRLWYWHRGQMHGPYVVWHPDGRPKIVGAYDSNQKVGRWLFWNAAGELDRVEDQPPAPASGG